MLLQPDTWSCGVYAIVNACLALGHDHTPEIAQIRQWANTTKERGTSEVGVIFALQQLEYSVQELEPIERSGDARLENLWTGLRNALDRGSPAILCVDGVDHWVAVVGGIGFNIDGKLLVFDSQRDTKESGLLVYDKRQFQKRLGGSRYALAISDLPEERDSLGRDANRDASTDVMASVMAIVGDVERGPSVRVSDQHLDTMPADLATWLLRGAGT